MIAARSLYGRPTEEDAIVVAQQQEADQSWSGLIEQDETARESQMLSRYVELAALSDEERMAKMTAMARAEYSLPDDKLRSFTLSRMRTWINLDMEQARKIADSYGAVMQTMPAGMAMKRVSLVQTLVTEFTPEEEEKLRELAPGAFAGAPSRKTGLERPDSLADVGKKKPFWKIW